jgi:hypothetical protein
MAGEDIADLLQRIMELEKENSKRKEEFKELEFSLRYGDLRKDILNESANYANRRVLRERGGY